MQPKRPRTYSPSAFNRQLKKQQPKDTTAYSKLLESPEWRAKRVEILVRDNHECQLCMSTTKLQVHHKKYLQGRQPWEYDNRYLITLCFSCHNKFHKKPITKKK